MRSYPLLTTLCCNANVCFRCKSPGHHEQVSCAATLEALTHQDDLGQCPHCLMAVVMGDGCSLVTCFCGYQFYRQEGVKSFQFMKVLSAIKSKLQRVFLRDRVLDAVSVAVTTKSNWDSYWATVTAEDQVALDDDMHSVIDGHHGWL
ncbi:hypothetical protein DYB25_011957 [Aphanomyces astaci]|uniref:Uncharacterized protein n=1 Tax=Aphanomyces astaci TaxID=112090 RepID=A0A397C054_APHAT|nr:hypothetical protein DYB25_011957 [Aphanomyces astaci]